MARATVWIAAAVGLAAVGCGKARPPGGAEANATAACSSCHSGPGDAPPFRDPTGATDPRLATVGAHDAHVHSDISADLACGQCHTVPRTVTDPGHMDAGPTDVVHFGPLAVGTLAAPSYDPQSRTCAAVYCHGSFSGGNTANAPVWTGGAAQAQCGSCHGLPPQTGAHPFHAGATFNGTSITCATCHGEVVPATHVNGRIDVALPAWNAGTKSCGQACHEPRAWGG